MLPARRRGDAIRPHDEDGTMSLMIVYIVLVFVGQAVAVTIGLLLDNFSKAMGLTVFLVLYFTVFVACWRLAVKLTEPGGLINARLER
jgi:hypothetical protein